MHIIKTAFGGQPRAFFSDLQRHSWKKEIGTDIRGGQVVSMLAFILWRHKF